MTQECSGKAFGKIVLLGEHAVVYGYPAVSASIAKGATAWARPAEAAKLRFLAQEEAPTSEEIHQALLRILDRLGSGPCTVTLKCGLPVGCGLGASAAMGVAVARSIQCLDGRQLDDPTELERTLAAAHAWESVFHGNPSGLDATVAAWGGCLRFDRSSGPQRITIGQEFNLAVAIADAPSSTRKMVERVAERRHRHAAETERILQSIGSLGEQGVRQIATGDLAGLGHLLDQNQQYLRQLGLSTPPIERACEWAMQSGALGAKLTGAGGGGCVIALAPNSASSILTTWRSQGLTCFATVVTDSVNPSGSRPTSARN